MSEHTPSTSHTFSDALAGTLCAVLDEIIPPSPERNLPGASDAGCLTAVAEAVAATPGLDVVLEQGANAADEVARSQGADGFAALPRGERRGVLESLAASQPGFLPSLTFHCYTSYYQAPSVVEALGLEYRPPHPKGYAMEPLDPALVEPVKRRGKMFRDV